MHCYSRSNTSSRHVTSEMALHFDCRCESHTRFCLKKVGIFLIWFFPFLGKCPIYGFFLEILRYEDKRQVKEVGGLIRSSVINATVVLKKKFFNVFAAL